MCDDAWLITAAPVTQTLVFIRGSTLLFFFSSRRRHTRSSTVSWAHVYKRQPQPFLHTVAAHEISAEDSAEQQTDQSHRAVGESVFLWRESQTALGVGAQDECLRHGVEQGLRKSV